MIHPKFVTVRFIRYKDRKRKVTSCLTVAYDKSFSLDCNVMFARSLALEDALLFKIVSVDLVY